MNDKNSVVLNINLVSLLRWLALIVVVVDFGLAIYLAVIARIFGGTFSAASFFTVFLSLAWVSTILYALSYIVSEDNDMMTVLSITITQLLRYMMIAVSALGLIAIILWVAVLANFGGGANVVSILSDLLSTFVAVVILYSLHFVLSKKEAKTVQIETKTKEITEELLSDEASEE